MKGAAAWRPPAALAPLRHRSFAALWTAGMISNAGSWMETVAVGALIKSTTGRDALVALAAVAAFLPIGLLSPLGAPWPTGSTAAGSSSC